jgi:hypothetical protein
MKDALPFGVGGGLVAIKTLLSRDPCVHANTAIEMIDAILKEHTAALVQEPQRYSPDGEGGMEVDSLGAYVKLQDVTIPPAQPALVPDWDAWNLISRLNCALESIGDYAHGKSTGPVVPDAFWEIRSMAYDAIEDATPLAAPVLEGRDWSLLEATQESLREHIAEIKRLKEAQPAVPDAITDDSESPEYRTGWNDCRAEMLKGMK